MAIKTISQLHASTKFENFDYQNATDLDGIFLEISEPNTASLTAADSSTLYQSKKLNLKIFVDALVNATIEKMQDTQLSVLSVGTLFVGVPGAKATDALNDTFWYDNNPEHTLSVLTTADFNNEVNFHNRVNFHNTIYIKTTTDNTAADGFTIESPMRIKGNVFMETNNKQTQYNLTCGEVFGIAQYARWADLAENYVSDNDYSPGTLVQFGGENEITIATDKVNAVITSKPGVLLNSELSCDNGFSKGIALIGRVPVKVIGKVDKFDKLILSHIPGIAIKTDKTSDKIIGIALESSDNPEEKLILTSVKMIL